MKYDFDEIISRKGTHAIKWEAGEMLKRFGMIERFDEDTLPFFIADMDFPCPQPMIDALHARADHKMFGYSIPETDSEYAEAIQGWFKRRHNWEIDTDSIVYSLSTLDALDALIRAFTEEGEKVIVQRPVYGPFTSISEQHGRVVVNNALINTDGYYTIDFEDFEEKASDPDTKMFLLCSPHNPIGRVWTSTELTQLAEICLANDVVLVADEIHGDLIRAGQIHTPIRTLADDPRIISITATNKTFNTAGLQCANTILASAETRQKFMEALGLQGANPFAITALIAAYNHGEDWLSQVNDYIDGNLAFMDQFFKEHMPAVNYRIPEGTYIAWVDFGGYGLTPEEIHDRIYNQANVVFNTGAGFCDAHKTYERICVPTPRSILQAGLERVTAVF